MSRSRLIALEDHGDHLHIFSVAVLPEHQSKGIGQRLLAFAEEQGARDGPATP